MLKPNAAYMFVLSCNLNLIPFKLWDHFSLSSRLSLFFIAIRNMLTITTSAWGAAQQAGSHTETCSYCSPGTLFCTGTLQQSEACIHSYTNIYYSSDFRSLLHRDKTGAGSLTMHRDRISYFWTCMSLWRKENLHLSLLLCKCDRFLKHTKKWLKTIICHTNSG